jgi:mono/diheme cytochrome c family protein
MPIVPAASRVLPALTGSLLVLLAGCARDTAADAARVQSAQRGKEIAQRMCAICHAVTPGQATGIPNAGPGFAEIANKPGRNRDNLTRFMGEWHELGKIDMAGIPMSTILLTPEQRADVVTYILGYQLDPATGARPPIGLRPF